MQVVVLIICMVWSAGSCTVVPAQPGEMSCTMKVWMSGMQQCSTVKGKQLLSPATGGGRDKFWILIPIAMVNASPLVLLVFHSNSCCSSSLPAFPPHKLPIRHRSTKHPPALAVGQLLPGGWPWHPFPGTGLTVPLSEMGCVRSAA